MKHNQTTNGMRVAICLIAALAFGVFGCGKSGERVDIKAEATGSSGRSGAVATDAAAPATSASSESSGEGSGHDAVTGSSEGSKASSTDANTASGQLTAAEWNDLTNWDFWTKLMTESEYSGKQSYWGLNVSGHIGVVVTSGGKPLTDAVVELKDGSSKVVWSARTDNRGRAHLFANSVDAPKDGAIQGQSRKPVSASGLTVHCNGTSKPVTISDTPVTMEVTGSEPENTADVLFMMDATGSMGDELQYIKSELNDVVERIGKENPGLGVRVSCNVYRDQGDEYVVRSFPFSDNVEKVLLQLRPQSADGGGDYEEAVEEGLYDAVYNHEWSSSARTRLAFLILDAPPHYTPEILTKIRTTTAEAAKRGIRIVPIVASGANKDLEFLMRLIAIQTGSTYTFLTDDSGIGDTHLKPTVGPHKIEFLNNLIVRLVNEYVAKGGTKTTAASAPGLR